jgi:hypothetical protein
MDARPRNPIQSQTFLIDLLCRLKTPLSPVPSSQIPFLIDHLRPTSFVLCSPPVFTSVSSLRSLASALNHSFFSPVPDTSNREPARVEIVISPFLASQIPVLIGNFFRVSLSPRTLLPAHVAPRATPSSVVSVALGELRVKSLAVVQSGANCISSSAKETTRDRN